MKRVISAGAVIFHREREGHLKFLLLYHGRGYWNFPKGRLEEGERAMEAFLREVEEETGLKRHDMRILPGFRATDRYTFPDRYGPMPADQKPGPWGGRATVFKLVIYYLVEARKNHIVISDEHEGFGWFTYHEALRMARYKNTQTILKQANDFIPKHLRRHSPHPQRQGRHVR